ncbi:MAG: hypothetical protein ACLPQS_05075 [Acidimicrobiales bacterium]|jgi:hypothetical protein
MSEWTRRRTVGRNGLGENFLSETPYVGPTPIPPRRAHPPRVWGSLVVEGDQVVVKLNGWRSLMAVKRTLAIPLSTVIAVSHDPSARLHVRTRLRKRGGRTGVFRIGAYHSPDGWSFWSVGLARHAVVVEASGARYRFLVVEVADPASTLEMIRLAAGLDTAATDAFRQEHPST